MKFTGRLPACSLAAMCLGLLHAGLTLNYLAPASAEVTVEQSWKIEYDEIGAQIRDYPRLDKSRQDRLTAEALDRQALILPTDKDPLDVVLRRTDALLQYYARHKSLPGEQSAAFTLRLQEITSEAGSAQVGDRSDLYDQACKLRREISFANPLLNFDDIVCMLEQPGDQRIIEQARAIWGGHAKGGGPVIIRSFKTKPTLEKPIEGLQVTSGPWQGKELKGKFSGLELSFDGTQLLFAATTDAEVWHIFRYDFATRQLAQLTDGPCDDFDPCLLPSGRIVFTSTRRGGVGRCVLTPQSLTYTLHSVDPNGSDIVCLSYHETNEWSPSVNQYGKLVYTRWDYVDRYWGTAHHFWECLPDGRDPRNFHGNYPRPYSSVKPGLEPSRYFRNEMENGRFFRPDAELGFREVPGSTKYVATAVGHHEGFSGTLILLDRNIPDDGIMSQLKRITPLYAFPEVEPGGPHVYGTPWPLSEDFYLCNFWSGLYLLDRFGNRELIYDPGEGPFRVRDPFPLRARPTPPDIPVMTWQGKRESLPDHYRAVLSVMNVYTSDAAGKLPPDTKVKWMRIVQVIPQLQDNWFSVESVSQVSFATDSIGRMSLGVVPVENDGSVYCEAPVGKAIYFQLLDEKGMAVHSMRSATYVHPGENLTCMGCHEDKWKPEGRYTMPKALQRAPSKLMPEVESGAVPFNYIQLVKAPVFDKKCVSCHQKHPNAPDMSYGSLARYDLAFSYPGEAGLGVLGVGGSRTTPGKFGARASGIVKSLMTRPEHKDLDLTEDDWRRINMWLDLNSNEIGWIGDDRETVKEQKEGKAIWPPIDVDPTNPTGVETNYPLRPAPK